jgi:hypothetical protein
MEQARVAVHQFFFQTITNVQILTSTSKLPVLAYSSIQILKGGSNNKTSKDEDGVERMLPSIAPLNVCQLIPILCLKIR